MKNQGRKFRHAVAEEHPLQIVGAINAYAALMAQEIGFKAIYLSGAGVANTSYGLPDLGITTLDNVLVDAERITAAVDIPLLVDIDTGWGNSFMIARTIKAMIRAQVAAVHIEDQVFEKRCGHRPGKALMTKEGMVSRIKAAVDARSNPDFVIIARTDAMSVEGFDKTVERALAYKEAGADMLFPEALPTIEDFHAFRNAVGIPILANATEFGLTPLYTIKEYAKAAVEMVLYPLSANRAMNKAALDVYTDIKHNGSQKKSLPLMQTRDELYRFLHYDNYERKADHLIM